MYVFTQISKTAALVNSPASTPRIVFHILRFLIKIKCKAATRRLPTIKWIAGKYVSRVL